MRRKGALLLATSSVAALVVGGSSAARAACQPVGPMGYNNPVGTTVTCIESTQPTVSGNVVNAGTVQPGGPFGIKIGGTSLLGAVINNGTIFAGAGTGIVIEPSSTFAGGITNAGTITALQHGVFISNVAAFGNDTSPGVIVNSGAINALFGTGIRVENVATFSGSITNSGTITAHALGIYVNGVAMFGSSAAAAIVNSGTINSAFGGGIELKQVAAFSGGITNSGAITAATAGIGFDKVATFSGGIANSGTITAGFQGIGAFEASTFSGGITNSGTVISANDFGIGTVATLTFSGGITNSGTITSPLAPGINVGSVADFSGGITNSGTISAGGGLFAGGIFAVDVTNFAGGIINTGSIHSTNMGIVVAGLNPAKLVTFSGGITNSGAITAAADGVLVQSATSFSGGILNSGAVTTDRFGIAVFITSTFTGGVTNSGTITATNPGAGFGIVVTSAGVFGGGNAGGAIVNSGTITAAEDGIHAALITELTGGINNSGTISADTGVFARRVLTFSGGILNSGTIAAASKGIVVQDVSTFLGGITNTGTIDAATGILITNTAAVNVFDSGLISGSGGTAIQFAAGPNTLTLGPGYSIVGNVIGSGSDLLQLGGASGSASFDVAGIGSTQQYQGFSTFEKIGASSWTLTGTNNLVLPWTMLDGTLNIDKSASLPNSPFTVDAGAFSVDGTVGPVTLNGGTLKGNGTLASLSVHSGAIVAPGHSIGQLNVVGNASFASGSIYQVETNANGQSDKIVAGGNAALTGGTVQAMPQVGNYGTSTTYTILTANGGVNGTFSNVTSSLPFLMPSLSYDADDVFLTLTRNTHFLQNQAQTPNQHAVASALDTFPTGNPLFLDVAALSGSTLLGAFDSLSGEVHASVQSVLIDGSRYFREAILGRLRQAAYANAGGQLAALGIGGPDIVYAYAGQRAANPAMPVKALPTKAPPASEYGITYWAQGLGAWGHIDSDGNAASVNDNHAGFFTGFDARFGTWRAGLAAGYTRANANIDARASSANVDTAHIGAYAGTQLGALNFRGGAAFAWHSIDTSRSIAFPGFFDQDKASYAGDTTQVFGEVGYGMQFGSIAAEPFAGLTYVHLDTNGFTETGNAAALSGNGASDDVGYSSLGIRAATRLTLADGKTLVPHASVAWQHAFGDVTPAAALAFESTGAAFTVSGVPFARDAVLVQAGIDYLLTANATLTLSYSGELAGTLQDHAVKGDFTWRF